MLTISNNPPLLLVMACFALTASASASAQTLDSFTEPYETINVASPESGIIGEIKLREGNAVAAGQIIGTLDANVLAASLAAARAKAESQGPLTGAEATFELRRIRHEKLKRLHTEGHASPEEVERAAADLAVAEAEFITAREQATLDQLEVKRIEAQIERRTIRSPIDGVIVRLHKKPGEFVASGDSLIATVVQLTELRARFYLRTERAATLEVDQHVDVELPQTDQSARGSIEYISPVTDSDSGTVRVEVIIRNTNGQYRSGVRCVLAPIKGPSS